MTTILELRPAATDDPSGRDHDAGAVDASASRTAFVRGSTERLLDRYAALFARLAAV